MPSPYAGRDVAIVFFKKYRHNVKPYPYNIPVVSFQKEVIPQSWEDSIEVVTLLPSKATLKVNGIAKTVAAGLASTKFQMRAGAVGVSIIRNKKTTVQFKTPEAITDKPYRADRLTYTFSSEVVNFYGNRFEGFKPIYSHEYNPAFKAADTKDTNSR